MSLADAIKKATPDHPIPELKHSWAGEKISGILHDAERTMRTHLEGNLGTAMGKALHEQEIHQAVDTLKPFVKQAVKDAVPPAATQGVVFNEALNALYISPEAGQKLESALEQMHPQAAPVMREALAHGLQKAYRSLKDAQEEFLTGKGFSPSHA